MNMPTLINMMPALSKPLVTLSWCKSVVLHVPNTPMAVGAALIIKAQQSFDRQYYYTSHHFSFKL